MVAKSGQISVTKNKKKVDRYHNSNGSGARDFCPNFMGCFVQ